MIAPPTERTAIEVVAELQIIARFDEQAVSIGELLIELQSLTNGEYGKLLRDIRPDLARPDAWADRIIADFRAACPSQTAAEAEPRPRLSPGVVGESTPTPSNPQEALPSPATAPGLSRTGSPSVPDERAAKLYPRLRPLLGLPRHARRDRINAIIADLGVSQSTVYGALAKLRESGDSATALNRKPRADRGQVQVDPEAKQFFLRRRLDPMTRHESVQLSIDLTKRHFAALDISEHSLRRVEKGLPAILSMRDDVWRKTFLPGGPVEVPHPNHTWVFDMSVADLFVWDRRDRPYRPNITAIVDECTQSCLYLLYTKEPPSRAVLQSVLLHAILPKSVDWPQCGLPLHLHCDNGKIQDSHWLRDVCRTFGTELGLMGDISHADAYSPWQDGHIERFFGILHSRLETQYAPAYCGRSPEHRPESFSDDQKAWGDYPTLERIQSDALRWIVADYHRTAHSRLGMSRLDYWQIHARDHVHLPPDEGYLRHALMQRHQAKVRRARVHLNNQVYWHERLMSWEGATLEVRWDPADLAQVTVLGSGGEQIVAQRERSRSVDNPADWAEHQRRKRTLKQERSAMQLTAEVMAGGSEADRGAFQRYLAEAEKSGPIPFPLTPRTIQPTLPEQVSADEILHLVEGEETAPPADSDPIEMYGLQL